MSQGFSTASELRKKLSEIRHDGKPVRYKIRRSSSPFDGPDRWNIELHPDEIPPGVSLISSGGSRSATTYASSDNGETAKKINAVKILLGTFMPIAT